MPTWYPSRTPVCARTRELVQTVRKRTFGSAHFFFTNSEHPSERLVDKGSIPRTRIQSTCGHVAYVCVGSFSRPDVAVTGSKVSETKYHVKIGAFVMRCWTVAIFAR